MPVNPARLSKKTNTKRKQGNPHRGVKRSDIRKKNGVGINASYLNGENTKTGYIKKVTDNKKFNQYYEIIYAGNAKEFGFSGKGTRVVHVLRGHLFVNFGNVEEEIGPEGEKSKVVTNRSVEQLSEGNFFEFKADVAYSLAAAGTYNTEILVTETVDYGKSWQPVEDSLVTRETSHILKKNDSPRASRRDPSQSNAKAAAEAYARQKGRGKHNQKQVPKSAQENNSKSTYSNPNSSTIVGVNPQPVIPKSED